MITQQPKRMGSMILSGVRTSAVPAPLRPIRQRSSKLLLMSRADLCGFPNLIKDASSQCRLVLRQKQTVVLLDHVGRILDGVTGLLVGTGLPIIWPIRSKSTSPIARSRNHHIRRTQCAARYGWRRAAGTSQTRARAVPDPQLGFGVDRRHGLEPRSIDRCLGRRGDG